MQEFNEGVERVTAGLEKKKRVIHLEEKQRVAYHESGHALVAYCLPNTDPVHKVSIIPRGLAALGYTMQRPEDDRYLMTQSELESRIQVLLAGTITEEIVFDDISTGAQNDLERATEIARSMVMDYGMSRLGRVNYRESNRSPFLSGGGGSDYRARPRITASRPAARSTRRSSGSSTGRSNVSARSWSRAARRSNCWPSSSWSAKSSTPASSRTSWTAPPPAPRSSPARARSAPKPKARKSSSRPSPARRM